jgi:hypothetical protein
MANIVFQLLGNAAELVRLLSDVAVANPISAVLVALGVILFAFSFGLFGYLTAGAFLSTIIPENIGRTPSQRGE